MSAPRFTLYGSLSPNVQKAILMLEEVGQPFRMVPLNVHRGEHFAPEFTRLNPLQRVPVLVDHAADEPLVIAESGAILIHLAESFGHLLPTEPRRRAEVLQWLMYQTSTVGPVWGQLNHFARDGSHDAYGLARFASAARLVYDRLEERLAVSPWLGGAQYSVADVAVWPWVSIEARLFGTRFPHMAIDAPGHPRLTAWFRRIEARPATRRAMAHIAALPSNRNTGTAEQEDRLVGRGAFARSLD
ncbi:glutathione S-transferase family protein [Paracoccus sp. S-4012]|uniref:glutathione S-transferase family protein n=1 Tax=Paracoccus sp. S-4012 TaxID=2665648 RepID=UPI0012B0407F|nr:glutathione S-transferase N-terminal domain-containing protein [Paracoccus sp. S-4012]